MSDTYRKVDWGWGPGNEAWERQFGEKVHSVKHQQRDRSESGHHRNRSKRHCFINGVKNCRYNLQHKVDDLRQREAMDDLS